MGGGGCGGGGGGGDGGGGDLCIMEICLVFFFQKVRICKSVNERCQLICTCPFNISKVDCTLDYELNGVILYIYLFIYLFVLHYLSIYLEKNRKKHNVMIYGKFTDIK